MATMNERPSRKAVTITAAVTPAVQPAERSISPRRSTKVTPIEIMMMGDACWSRLPKFCSDRNVSGREKPNTATSTRIESVAG